MKKIIVNVALILSTVLLFYFCGFNIREFVLLVQAGYNSATPYYAVDIINYIFAFIGECSCITALIMYNRKNKDGK